MEDKRKRETLLNCLEDTNSFLRRQAIASLEELGDVSVIPALTKLLRSDDSPYVRRAVAAAFGGKLRGDSVIPALKEALGDESPHVRAAAAGALGRIGGEKMASVLCALLKDEDSHVRSTVALTLGQLGDRAAVEGLKELTMNKNELSSVKDAAFLALRQLGVKSEP